MQAHHSPAAEMAVGRGDERKFGAKASFKAPIHPDQRLHLEIELTVSVPRLAKITILQDQAKYSGT